MRIAQLALPLALILLPSSCFALMFSVKGNQPQSPANYSTWPGLADLVNQANRQNLTWCNGAESGSYSGNLAALNAALQLFSKIGSPTHKVVLRPGPPKDAHAWELHIVQGIVRHHVVANDLDSVRDLDPTLVVDVSPRLNLNSIRIPANTQLCVGS